MHSRKRLAVALSVGACCIPIAGCGDDSDDTTPEGSGSAESKTLELTITSNGAVEAPATAEAGVTEIVAKNDAEKPGFVQIIRVEGDHTAEETAKVFEDTEKGKPVPDWFLAAGGPVPPKPGKTTTTTQVFEPGTYFLFGEGPNPPAELEVTGEAADAELPETDASVTASEYKFEAENLTSGSSEITFENAGEEPHHIVAFPILGDATLEEVEAFAASEGQAPGPPPVDFRAGVDTAVIEGGTSQVVDLNIAKPGRYAFVCFISDRAGGPPHVAKGMISEIEVQ